MNRLPVAQMAFWGSSSRPGCDTYCLEYWLGVEPGDYFEGNNDTFHDPSEDLTGPDESCQDFIIAAR